MANKRTITFCRWLLVGLGVLLSTSIYAGDPLFGTVAEELARDPGHFATKIYSEIFPPLSLAVALGTSSQARIADSIPIGYQWEVGSETGIPLPSEKKGAPNALAINSAITLGVTGEKAFAFCYTFRNYTSFDGISLNKVLDTPKVPIFPEFPELGTDQLDMDLSIKTHLFSFAWVYALSDRTDVGLAIPIISNEWSGQLLSRREVPGADNEQITLLDRWRGGATGIGDIQWFLKHNVLQYNISCATPEAPPRGQAYFSWAHQLKAPTGNTSRTALLGTGAWEYKLSALMTFAYEKINFKLDMGYNFNGLGQKYNAFEYRFGSTWAINENWSGTLELLGSHSRSSVYRGFDGVIGCKYNPTKNLLIDAGVRFTLQRQGLKPDWAPIFAMEYRF